MARPTLTRTDQVRKAVRKGARIEAYPDRPTLLRLVDRKGHELPAWQTALKAALKPAPKSDEVS